MGKKPPKDLTEIQEMLKEGKYDVARPLLKEYLKAYPKDPLAIRFLGNTYAYTGFLGKAKQIWRDGLKKVPDNVDLIYNLGLAYYLQGNLTAAKIQWKKASKMSPKDAEIIFNLGQIARDEGRLRAAISLWRKALEIDFDNVETMNNIGVAFATLRMFGKASLWYKKALIEEPDYAVAHFNLATAKFETGQLDEARSHAEKAAQLDPSTHLETSNNLIKRISELKGESTTVKKSPNIQQQSSTQKSDDEK